MVSNTHEDGQIVVSEQITLASPPTNTHGSNNENDLSVEAVAEAVDNENELPHTEKGMILCDACGDQGYGDSIVICKKCKVGAEHAYCMMVKPDVLEEWICHDCTEDKDGVVEGEETSAMMEERALSQKKPDLLRTGRNIDRNVDPNIDTNEEPSSRKRKIGPSDDFSKLSEEAASRAGVLNTKSPRKTLLFDLNKEPNPDFDEDPNIGLV